MKNIIIVYTRRGQKNFVTCSSLDEAKEFLQELCQKKNEAVALSDTFEVIGRSTNKSGKFDWFFDE